MKTLTFSAPSAMQRVIEMILEKHGQLANFRTVNADGFYEFHLRVSNDPWMPLIIERHGDNVCVGHTYRQNGDTCYDPEIVFKLPTWEPVELTQHPMGLYRAKYSEREDGRKFIDSMFDPHVVPFVTLWARNLRDQGFISHSTATSSTHPK